MPPRSGYLVISLGTLLLCLLIIICGIYGKRSQVAMMEKNIHFFTDRGNVDQAPVKKPVYNPNNHFPVKKPLYDANITLYGLKIEEIKGRAVKGNINNYLEDYKNPCWFEGTTSRKGIRCLPYFYELGVAKSGSTSLYWNLRRHPQITIQGKELNYWQSRGKNMSLGIEQYLNQMQNSSFAIYDRKNPRTGYNDMVMFDATPVLISQGQPEHRDNLNNQQEPIYTLAHTLYTLNPKTFLLVTMRDPIDRLFSDYHYIHNHPENISGNDFHDWSKRGVNMMNKCLDHRTLRSCVFDQELIKHINCIDADYHQVSRFQLSMYYPFVKEFLSVFPREQMYFIKAQELYCESRKVMTEVFNFLELEEPSDKVWRRIVNPMNAKCSQSIREDKNGESYRTLLMPQTKAMLNAFFAPYNQQLAELLHDDKWLFK